jgi:hypothetical protein
MRRLEEEEMRKRVTDEELKRLNDAHTNIGKLTLLGARGALSEVEGEAAKEYVKETLAWELDLIARYLTNPNLNPKDFAIDHDTGELITRKEAERKMKEYMRTQDFREFLQGLKELG